MCHSLRLSQCANTVSMCQHLPQCANTASMSCQQFTHPRKNSADPPTERENWIDADDTHFFPQSGPVQVPQSGPGPPIPTRADSSGEEESRPPSPPCSPLRRKNPNPTTAAPLATCPPLPPPESASRTSPYRPRPFLLSVRPFFSLGFWTSDQPLGFWTSFKLVYFSQIISSAGPIDIQIWDHYLLLRKHSEHDLMMLLKD